MSTKIPWLLLLLSALLSPGCNDDSDDDAVDDDSGATDDDETAGDDDATSDDDASDDDAADDDSGTGDDDSAAASDDDDATAPPTAAECFDGVFANMFEYTDGTGCVDACPLAELAGFGAPWDDSDELADMVIWANEQFLSIAVETGTDMIFMLENFCGHGFYHDHPLAPCYRGKGNDCWFDLTCIHPNPDGHAAIAEMFMAVVDE